MRIGRLNPPQLLAQSLFWCADSEIIFRPPAMLLGANWQVALLELRPNSEVGPQIIFAPGDLAN